MTHTPLSDLQHHIANVLDEQKLSSLAQLDSLTVKDGHAHIVLKTTPQAAEKISSLRTVLEKAISLHDAVKEVSITMTRHHATPAAPKQVMAAQKAPHRPLNLAGNTTTQQKTSHHKTLSPEQFLPHVKAVIAVASGKGGVGKSTTAINLACGLAKSGLKTGLLDADVHGPSLPHMLGKNQRPTVIDRKLHPVESWGLQTMSIGYLVDEKEAMIWRGPMVMGALIQFMNEVEWGELDVLVVDMPPGTGDAQLTLTQKLGSKLQRGGAIIVSTPQDIALLDARRGATLFEKTHTPILGLVENMSYFCCPNCQTRTELFGHGGARQEAERLNLPFLGEIPLLRDIRLSADDGTPLIVSAPESEGAHAYQAIANTIATHLKNGRI
ncbi:P-loop NTPase [Saccharibacter sp. 17.LH.SD]|uniref:Mrp/NBP35 family ATP-binding protein n=1 Tax=Saccharibacter sp. 17.LH.SD TaxID=2689393 RepID=UPI001368AC59|nr:Mrp/NBP35 family ATP-binding protein [Saccharibacter sp. 17.LH.SD]MXV44906.1 P-loop NTPase [Saccharibacter sp. 17.LH.SD]